MTAVDDADRLWQCWRDEFTDGPAALSSAASTGIVKKAATRADFITGRWIAATPGSPGSTKAAVIASKPLR